MRSLAVPRWFVQVGSVVVLAAVGSACSASSGDPGETAPFQEVDAGIKLPDQEICGNGLDDNRNGLVDENCGCGTGGSKSTEVQGSNGCPTGGGGGSGGSGSETASGGSPPVVDAGPSCEPTETPESSCNDGIDEDCDGLVDCDDPDCRKPGQCGCQPTELACGDGKDDDCDGKQDCADEDCKNKCMPGSQRFCDEPNYCNWGQQTCGPDGNWGPCVEVPAPSGCEGMFWDNSYDSSCCVAQGYCCQAYPAQNSQGNCVGVTACP